MKNFLKKLFGAPVMVDNNTIHINGTNYSGRNITVKNGVVTIDGVVQKGTGNNILEIRVSGGSIGKLETDASVSCEDITGDLKAGGSVSCGNVGGSVKAGGSVSCGDIYGNLSAGGSIRGG